MEPRLQFLVSEMWLLSWGASVQRAGLFAPRASEPARRRFRNKLIAALETDVLPAYASPVSEAEHIANVQRTCSLAAKLDDAHVLHGGRYKLGVCQKLLNLQLKYLWCLDLVAEPPHCPVDRIIISKTRLREKVNWTGITTATQYQRVIDAIKEVAQPTGLSLAQWELTQYARRSGMHES